MELYSAGALNQQHKHIILFLRSKALSASSAVLTLVPIGLNYECVNGRRASTYVGLGANSREAKVRKFYPLFPFEYEFHVLNNVFYCFEPGDLVVRVVIYCLVWPMSLGGTEHATARVFVMRRNSRDAPKKSSTGRYIRPLGEAHVYEHMALRALTAPRIIDAAKGFLRRSFSLWCLRPHLFRGRRAKVCFRAVAPNIP